jgi:hypothetical protein
MIGGNLNGCSLVADTKVYMWMNPLPRPLTSLHLLILFKFASEHFSIFEITSLITSKSNENSDMK